MASSATPSSSSLCSLSVTCICASHLRDKAVFATLHPYLVLKIKDQRLESDTKFGAGSNPVWNQTLVFTNLDTNKFINQSLDIEVWDAHSIGKDKLISFTSVHLESLFPQAQFKPYTTDVPLHYLSSSGHKKQKGTLRIRFLFSFNTSNHLAHPTSTTTTYSKPSFNSASNSLAPLTGNPYAMQSTHTPVLPNTNASNGAPLMSSSSPYPPAPPSRLGQNPSLGPNVAPYPPLPSSSSGTTSLSSLSSSSPYPPLPTTSSFSSRPSSALPTMGHTPVATPSMYPPASYPSSTPYPSSSSSSSSTPPVPLAYPDPYPRLPSVSSPSTSGSGSGPAPVYPNQMYNSNTASNNAMNAMYSSNYPGSAPLPPAAMPMPMPIPMPLSSSTHPTATTTTTATPYPPPPPPFPTTTTTNLASPSMSISTHPQGMDSSFTPTTSNRIIPSIPNVPVPNAYPPASSFSTPSPSPSAPPLPPMSSSSTLSSLPKLNSATTSAPPSSSSFSSNPATPSSTTTAAMSSTSALSSTIALGPSPYSYGPPPIDAPLNPSPSTSSTTGMTHPSSSSNPKSVHEMALGQPLSTATPNTMGPSIMTTSTKVPLSSNPTSATTSTPPYPNSSA